MNKKDGFISYVLVPNQVPGNTMFYYAGYFILKIIGTKKTPIMYASCTEEFVKAMKIPFKDEAEAICIEVNKNCMTTKFHVQEHAYL